MDLFELVRADYRGMVLSRGGTLKPHSIRGRLITLSKIKKYIQKNNVGLLVGSGGSEL